MRASPQQDINVHLAGSNQQSISIARRNNGMAMGESDTETPVSHDFGKREVGRVDIVVSLDKLQVRCDLAEELKGLAVGQVAQTQNLADLAGGEEFFELLQNMSGIRTGVRIYQSSILTRAGRS